MDPIETYKHAGVTVEIYQDDDASNPRTEQFREMPGMIYQMNNPRSGTWGDEQVDFEGSIECPNCEGSGDSPTRFELIRGHYLGRVVGAGSYESMSGESIDDPELSVRPATCPRCKGERELPATLGEWIAAEHGADAIWLPIDHWDDWRPALKIADNADDADGFIVCDGETAAKEWSDREGCLNYLRAEVSEYSSYLQGDVFGYVIKGPDGEELDGRFTDSCWGFIGDEKYVREEANRAAETTAEALMEEAAEADDMAARDIVTVD